MKCAQILLALLIASFSGHSAVADDNSPRYERPQLLGEFTLPSPDRHLLLVDDVSVSGKTMALAKEVLADYQIVTLVMKGKADYVLFPEIAACVQWPWQPVR